ncbi:hypothetical protein N0V83_004313 [Neocucurbitaria cava]|uniref:Uncharacterized protein n=1 Tax=Neocucurbitaria cava TaxID=798079 RepID=A0A9W8Y8Y8_9PLEO|nr:hypothetical protein N0V83_004313 [Neocucurbitaria cava]
MSRYAALGLNGKPAHVREESNMSLRSILDSLPSSPEHPTNLQRTGQRTSVSVDEDLAELEEMMLHAHGETRHANLNTVSTDSQQLFKNRKSRFTTGWLSESGWQDIRNTNWDVQQTGGRPNGQRGATDKGVNSADLEGDGDESAPLLNEKYFDYEGYLDHLSGNSPGNIIRNAFEGRGRVGAKTSHSFIQTIHGKLPDRTVNIIQTTPKVSLSTSEVTVINEAVEASAGDGTGKWEVEGGDTDTVRIGTAAPEKLTIRLRNADSRGVKTLAFRKFPHEEIEWSNKAHIQEISKWRSQTFRRHGIAPKSLYMPYSPEEDAWLVLYHKKLKATVEAGNIVKLPGPVPTTEAFNRFFEGKVQKDGDGIDQPPHPAREETSIKGKISKKGSVVWRLRDVTRRLLEAKHGGKLYVPVITEDELRRYQQDGSVTIGGSNEGEVKAAPRVEVRTVGSSLKRKREEEDGGPATKRPRSTS